MRATPALRIPTRLICFTLLCGALTGTAHPAPPPTAPSRAQPAPQPCSAASSGSHVTNSTLAGEDVGNEASTAAKAAPVVPRAGDPNTEEPLNWRRQSHAAVTEEQAALQLDVTPNDPAPALVLSWETGTGKSYLIPAVEVPTFLVLLNLYDRTFLHSKTRDGRRTYDTNLSTAWDHLTEQDWVYDQDRFNVNQIGHPYQGATMYGIARSSGLNFWQSLFYSNAGSFMWEMAGENSRPSINDLITTGNAGSLFGEALFRMSSLVLEDAPRHDTLHEVGAALISPPTGFNRWAFGERFKPIFPSHQPALFWRGRLGASVSGNSQQNAAVDFQMSYGLPGKPGYTYQRPFDYFDFQMGGLSRANNPVSYVLLRGLLYGRDYHAGENYRGIWGLYGGYDYFSPTAFRVSTTALSLGTTGQYWLGREVALQGSVLGGLGFGAAGKTPSIQGNRDYHYGLTPQVLLALRLLLTDRAAIETIGRGYYVSGTGSDNSNGYEQIARVTTGFTVRVYGRHAVGLQFVESLRYAHYGSLPRTRQSDGTVSLVYTFLGDSRFGAVEWREQGGQ